jgi:hypothetical protein
VDSGGLVGRGIAHQRNEAGVAHAGAERAARVEAQHVVDAGRQGGDVDAADLGEVARGERARDRPRLLPQP